MKKGYWIILTVIVLLIILIYFFHPLCGFHRIGSTFKGGMCVCKVTGSFCLLEGITREMTDADKVNINNMFSDK